MSAAHRVRMNARCTMAFSCSNRRRSSLAFRRWRVISLFLRPSTVYGVCSAPFRGTHCCFSVCFSCLSSDSSFLTACSLLVFSIRTCHFVLCPAEDCERLVGGLIKTSAQHEGGDVPYAVAVFGSFHGLPDTRPLVDAARSLCSCV